MANQSKATVQLELTVEQAQAVSRALEVYTRLGIGQTNIVSEMAIGDEITVAERLRKNEFWAEDIRWSGQQMKTMLGYQAGESAGINNAPIKASRCHEVGKVLDKALAEHLNPNPSFRGPTYDGLIVRYTDDPAPVVSVCTGGAE